MQKPAGIGSNQKTRDIKLVAFDFDGTIAVYSGVKKQWGTAIRSSWALIGNVLGEDEERRMMNDAYHRGEFDYPTWARLVVENFKNRGLTRQKLEDMASKNMELVPGASRLLRELKRRGIKSAVISSGIENVYGIFVKKFGLKIDYVRIAHRLNFDSKGKLTGCTTCGLDYEGKLTVLRDICKESGISMKQCAYVGDEANDIPVLRKVGLPVAINTKNEELMAIARVTIDSDISQLLKYI